MPLVIVEAGTIFEDQEGPVVVEPVVIEDRNRVEIYDFNAVYRGKIADIEAEMRTWLVENEYSSVTQLRGSASQGSVEDPGTFERAQYIRTLHSWAAPPNLTPTA